MSEFNNWKKSKLLVGLTDENLKLLALVLDTEIYVDGDIIIRDGDEGNQLYIIESGSVQILKEEILLATKGESEHFGVMALLDDSKRSADVRAKGDLIVLSTSMDKIKRNYTPEIYTTIISNHLKQVQGELRKMNQSNVVEIKEKLNVISTTVASIKSSISSDLHDDVGTILAGIAMQSEILALSLNDDHKLEMQEMSDMSRDAMERMRDIVWSMDNNKDKYENLLDKMRDFATKKFAKSDFSYSFKIDGIEGSAMIPQVLRKNMYLIFKEALTNILKHSKGDDVVIKLMKNEDKLQLSIFDNGPVAELSKSEGMGLSNMKMRAEKMGASFVINQENGFEINVTV